MITIEESNMSFGPYEDKNVFYIEQSELYKSIGDKVKIAEFVLKSGDKLIFLEAKSSSPQPTEHNTVKFNDFIEEIATKLRNCFELFLSSYLNIKTDGNKKSLELLDSNTIHQAKLKFYLVINGHKKDWLPPIKNALDKCLIAQRKIWNIDITVLNDELARRYKLII